MKVRPREFIAVLVSIGLLAGLGYFAAGLLTSGRSTSQQVGPEAGVDAVPESSPLIDPDRLISGGPPPDGIPPIDDPRFIHPADVDFLVGREPVLSLEIGEEARAYPLQILTWHEIVNDTVAGTPVVVTYCPLCNTGIAFRRPRVDGHLLDFGTSGMLYNSNLVMYDRQTDSLWPQAIGIAVQGPLKGRELEFLPVQLVSWSDWKAENPDGRVLSRETGADRPYGQNPYPGYDDPGGSPFLFDGKTDPRLRPLERVLGVVGGRDLVAVPYAALSAGAVEGSAVAEITLDGEPAVVFWKKGTLSALDADGIADSKDVGAAGAFRPRHRGEPLSFEAREGGIFDRETGSSWSVLGRAVAGPLKGEELEPLLSIDSFWFDWAAFHPSTKVYGA